MSEPDAGSGRGEEIRCEIRINAAPQTVFALLTDPKQMTTWLAREVEADPRPGGIFRIADPAGVSIEGRYVEVVPNEKVVFTWGGVEGLKPGQTTVEILLEREGRSTLLRLRHYRLPKPAVEAHERSWVTSGLPKLKSAAEGRDPGGTCLEEVARGQAGGT